MLLASRQAPASGFSPKQLTRAMCQRMGRNPTTLRSHKQRNVETSQADEALATIAEIATRTSYVSKPPNALSDDIINAGVMHAMIDRDRKMLSSACLATTVTF